MNTELIRYEYKDVEVIDPPQERPFNPFAPFAAMFEKGFRQAHSQEHSHLLTKIINVRDEWLNQKTAISGSASTRRTYITALDTFLMYVQVDPLMIKDERRRLIYLQSLANQGVFPEEYRDPWTIDARDAVGYRLWLEDTGRSTATTAHYMAVASSFFQYVIERTEMSDGGIESSLFFDATGKPRSNPFRNKAVSRPKVNPYGKSKPIARGDAQTFFNSIKADHRPVVRARDMALFKAYILTGRRATEIVSLRWGDITETGDGKWEFQYVGKGHGRSRGDDAGRLVGIDEMEMQL